MEIGVHPGERISASQLPGDGAPLISLQRAGKEFANGTVAVRDMTLDVLPGQFVSLLGSSGCGKSTVLKMIAGLLPISSGSITVNGDPPGTKTGGHDLGFVFQEPTLMPWATVFDNVYLPLRIAGTAKKDVASRIDEALASVGLSAFANAYPRELSGGMKMRVSIARAMVTRPRLLLMDEPFAALDEMTRFKLNDDVLKLWSEQDLTVVFVTHSVYEAVYLSGRVVVMETRPGRVADDIALDTPYPRDDDYRTSSQNNENARRVSTALQKTLLGDAIA